MKQLIYMADALSGCTLQYGHNQRIQLITYMINKQLMAKCGWLFKLFNVCFQSLLKTVSIFKKKIKNMHTIAQYSFNLFEIRWSSWIYRVYNIPCTVYNFKFTFFCGIVHFAYQCWNYMARLNVKVVKRPKHIARDHRCKHFSILLIITMI